MTSIDSSAAHPQFREVAKLIWIAVCTNLGSLARMAYRSTRSTTGTWVGKTKSDLVKPENRLLRNTLFYLPVWLLLFAVWNKNLIAWAWLHWVLLPFFLPCPVFALYWLKKSFSGKWGKTARLRILTFQFLPASQLATYILDGLSNHFEGLYQFTGTLGNTLFAINAIAWATWFCWDLTMANFQVRKSLTLGYTLGWCLLWYFWSTTPALVPELFLLLYFSLSLYIVYIWVDMARRWDDILKFRGVLTACIFPVWLWLVFATNLLGWGETRSIVAGGGLAAAFFSGLAWTIWYVDKRSWELQQNRFFMAAEGHERVEFTGPLIAMNSSAAISHEHKPIIDPFDLDSCFYGGGERRKLNQSLSTILSYSILFFLLFLLLTSLSGCFELYEMPAGGGEQQPVQQVVVQKVIKKKFVINPFSAVLFNPPPIDQVQLQLNELTKHAYTVGYGQGKGAGFSGGTNRGVVRFIRLQYNGGDWDQDFGVGADLNLLIEYNVRTRQKVAKQTESRKIVQLANFPKGKSPPMVYMTGQRNISVNSKEIEILREYLTDKNGMLFADNGGSGHWHGQFFNLMKQVLPKVRPVKIPLDHDVHRVPFTIPYLPYVAPHGGKDAYGWVVDSRLVAYYHPGDIGDAWADGHAGVSAEIAELCYQLGTNVIFYAHAEYNKFLDREGFTGK